MKWRDYFSSYFVTVTCFPRPSAPNEIPRKKNTRKENFHYEKAYIFQLHDYLIRYNSPCSRRVSVGELYELDLLSNRNILAVTNTYFSHINNISLDPEHWWRATRAPSYALIGPKFLVISPTCPAHEIKYIRDISIPFNSLKSDIFLFDKNLIVYISMNLFSN